MNCMRNSKYSLSYGNWSPNFDETIPSRVSRAFPEG
jgi:hypothetical protein